MERGANAVLARVDTYPLGDVPATLKSIGNTLRRELGGSSGPLYGVLFLRCGRVLEAAGAAGLAEWAEALAQGSAAITELGGAKAGDRTMLDALDPFVKALRDAAVGDAPVEVSLKNAVEAAERGAEATAHMKPRLGRSSYLGDRVIGHVDPGAKAVAIWLRAAVEAGRYSE
jgi:dihydroxyacetone kinase